MFERAAGPPFDAERATGPSHDVLPTADAKDMCDIVRAVRWV